MQPDNNPVSRSSSSTLETIAFYVFVIVVTLVPFIFWPSRLVTFELVKSVIIVLGSMISAILFLVIALKERRLALPPKNIFWTGALIGLSLLISALGSINASKSLFGQGFELGTAGFMLALFVSAFCAFTIVARKPERAVVMYVGLGVSFVILFLIQLLRFIFGADFATMGILDSMTSTLIGSWFNLGIFSMVIGIISFVALMSLPLSGKMKTMYSILGILGFVLAFLVNAPFVWFAAALVALALACFFTKSKSTGLSFFRRLAWVPAIAFIVLAVLSWKGGAIAGPVSVKTYGGYSEISLPWQMTLDVTSSVIKNYPLFGVGPNHFVRAFMAYKPSNINPTDAWGLEFSNGFSTVSTFISSQGMVGAILWLLFFVFFGIAGARALKRIPEGGSARFIIVSSFFGAAFLWLNAILYVPSHVNMFMAFVLTGVFFGGARAYGANDAFTYEPGMGSKAAKFMPAVLSLMIVVAAVWGFMYLKKTVALAYFSSGVKVLTVEGGDPLKADAKFKTALAIDSSDVFWQARAEAALAQANKIALTATSTDNASSTQEKLNKIVEQVNLALSYSRSAIALDKTNYYNYISEARVSESAMNLKMEKAYENAVQAYQNAIALNPYNPSLYLSLARLHASQNKLDDSLQAIGASLSVKNNYLDAIYLLSQVNAAKGNLAEAITAAKVAIQINPQNALLQFQLGLLEFNNKNWQGAADAFGKAVEIQKDYANAKYFLGLAKARLGKTAEAISDFAELAATNPDNQEITLILENLKTGKAIFADAQPPVTPNPEKRSSLPVKEKK